MPLIEIADTLQISVTYHSFKNNSVLIKQSRKNPKLLRQYVIINKMASSLHSEVQSAVDWTRQSADNTSIFYDASEINFNDYLEKRKTINSVQCKELLRWFMVKITDLRFYIEVLFHQGISNYFHITCVLSISFSNLKKLLAWKYI